MYNFYSVQYYKHSSKCIVDHLYTYKNHLQNKQSVYLSIFLKLC